jgi:glycosyltransferase involved in cell wall biosynthesis
VQPLGGLAQNRVPEERTCPKNITYSLRATLDPLGMKTDTPVATIVITTRNRPEWARRALRTALSQTVRDIQVIVVDDASDPPFDRGPDLDPRVELVRFEQNLGLCAARNAGLERARARWITHLDDDDELLPHMVEVSVKAAAASELPKPVAVVSAVEHVLQYAGRSEIVKPVSLPRGSHFLLSVGGSKFSRFPPNALLVEAAVLRDIGGWDTNLSDSWQYDDLYLRLNPVCSIHGLTTVTYRMHAHTGVRASQNFPQKAEDMSKILAKHHEIFRLYPRKHAVYLRGTGIAYLRAGDRKAAIVYCARALWRYPFDARGIGAMLLSLGGPRAYRLARPLIEASLRRSPPPG